MDEAEVLGDKIGIMERGKMICIGSKGFLKQRYGLSYNLDIELRDTSDSSQIDTYLEHKLGNRVRKLNTTARLTTYQLPHMNSNQFRELLAEFDSELPLMPIVSDYRICKATLEDIFLVQK